MGFGGGIGSIARFVCQKYIHEWNPHPFPIGTFLVNIFGCFLIGLFYGSCRKRKYPDAGMEIITNNRFLRRIHYFFTFAFENINLLKTGDFVYFCLYTAGSIVLGIGATYFGMVILKLI